MNTLQKIFSNREISLLIWICVSIIIALTQKSIRLSLAKVLKLLIGKYFIAIYLTLGVYLLGIFLLLNVVGFWTFADLKDSIIWMISVVFILVLNTNKAIDSNYFKNIIIDTIKAIVVLEFIVNFYTFNLVTELILLPIMTFIGLLQVVSSYDSKNAQIANLLTNLLAIFGLGLLLFSIYKMIRGYSDFFTLGTLHSFILPIVLTALFIPYLYLLTLYSIYESYFVRLDLMSTDKIKIRKVKKYIRRTAHVSINRLNRLVEHFDKSALYTETNLKEYIKMINNKGMKRYSK